jgi:hypothetical protein
LLKFGKEVELIQSLEEQQNMFTSVGLKAKLQDVVEQLWSEHRASKTERGEKVPDADSNAFDDAGCGCKACLAASDLLREV